MQGATKNNQNRLHLGYHYPRDDETALQCQRGFHDFMSRFSECIVGDFPNIYCISDKDSKVSFAQYLDFCSRVGLDAAEYEISAFPHSIDNIQGAINTKEVVYDCDVLKRLVSKEMYEKNIKVFYNSFIEKINLADDGFLSELGSKKIYSRSIINCTYSNLNMFNSQLGVKSEKLKFELTVVPIINWRKDKSPIGITVMDGPFFTVLPHGKSNNYLLYHVCHSVVDSWVGETFPSHWGNLRNVIDVREAEIAFEKMVRSASEILPDLKHAEFVDYLATVRVVLANAEASDKRPSLLTRIPIELPLYTVFSGKIDHSIWLSRELGELIAQELKSSG